MKVILNRDVPNVGRKGELHEVTDAFARNFLIPQQAARTATPAALAAMTEDQAKQQKSRREKFIAYQSAREKLQGLTVQIKLPANPQGTLFAAYREQNLKELLKKEYRIETDEAKFTPDHWKELGRHVVDVTWPDNQKSQITIDLVAQ